MKYAFTMIELVFTIIILGILAAVAILRLVATRNDAEISKFAMHVSMSVMDISAYYTSKGEFGDIKKMTHSVLDSNGKIKVKDIECLQISTGYATAAEMNPTKGIILGTPIIKIVALNNGNEICGSAQQVVKKIIDTSPINIGQNSVKFN